jgi:hypothetical protein
MTTAIVDADPRVPGPPPGNREFRHFVTALGIVYVVATLAIFAKLLVFPATRSGSAPAIAGATSIASDITAIHADPSGVADFTVGSGYVEFDPPPAGPRSTLGFSPTSTTKQAQESGKPADAQPGRVVAHTREF